MGWEVLQSRLQQAMQASDRPLEQYLDLSGTYQPSSGGDRCT